MTNQNKDGRSLIIDLGDLPGLTALAIQDRPERTVIWHPILTDEAAPRRTHAVAEHTTIYAVDEVIEFPVSSMMEHEDHDISSWLFHTEETAPVELWSILLLSAAWSATARSCSRIIFPIHLGCNTFEEQARATELHELISSIFDLSQSFHNITIELPFIDLEDWRLIDLAARTEAPLRACWWCLHNSAEPCNGCDSCRRWEKALKQANIESPWQTTVFQ